MITPNISQENRLILEVLGYKLIDIEEYLPTNYNRILNNVNLSDKDYLMHGKDAKDNG